MDQIALLGWLGLGLSLTIQAVGVGLLVGTMRTTLRGLSKEVTEHKELAIPRGHSCAYFTPHASGSLPPEA